jgi:hypothetical protein
MVTEISGPVPEVSSLRPSFNRRHWHGASPVQLWSTSCRR